jgi:PAS domain S-box-containing protein
MECDVTEGGNTMTETGSSVAGVTEEWLATAVVKESPEAIVVTDPAGLIRLWNDGAARMFGFSAEEAIGQNLDIIIPEKQRERHWKGYFQTMATGYTRYGDKLLSVPASHRDGQRLSIEFSVALLRDDADQIVGITAIMREVSERRNAERALRAKITELENRAGSA